MAMARSQDFKLEGMILAFPSLVTAKKIKRDDGSIKLEFQASLLWPKGKPLMGRWESGEQFTVESEMLKVATAEWGDKALGLIQNKVMHNPILDGDGNQAVNKTSGERYKGFAGHHFIRVNAQEKFPPRLFDDKLGNDGKLVVITDPNRLYPGCRVHAAVNIYSWKNEKKGPGLSFGIRMMQFAGDGERLASGGGEADPSKFFTGAPAAVSAGAGRPSESAASGAGGLFA